MSDILIHVPRGQVDHVLQDKGDPDVDAHWVLPSFPRRLAGHIYLEAEGQIIARALVSSLRKNTEGRWCAWWHGRDLEEPRRWPRAPGGPARGFRYLTPEESRELALDFEAPGDDSGDDFDDAFEDACRAAHQGGLP